MKTLHTHIWAIAAILLLLVLALSCGGIYASFNYSRGNALSLITNPAMTLAEFQYKVSGFPNTDEGKRNEQLTLNILNAINDPNSKTNASIEGKANEAFGWFGNHDTLGNMDYHYGEDMESELFDDTTGQDMTFLIFYPNGVDSNYVVFTTATPIVRSSSDTWFANIYRTVMVRNADGSYTAEPSEVGWAKYTVYRQQFTGGILISEPSFDPSSWTDTDPTKA